MRKIISILFIGFFAIMKSQADTTTSLIVASDVTIDSKATEPVYMTISLQGNTVYSGYNVDIYLPDGITMATLDGELDVYLEDNMYPVVQRKITHELMSEYNQEKNRLRMVCVSVKGKDMVAGSGTLFYIGIQPTASAMAGTYDVRLTESCLISTESVNYFAQDTTAKLIITDATDIKTVEEQSNNAIYTIDGIRTVSPQKGHMYIVDGKKMKY